MRQTMVLLMLAAAGPQAAAAFAGPPALRAPPSSCARGARQGTCSLAMAAATAKRGPVAKALKKPTGALTVSFEFCTTKDKALSELGLSTLSMQLRKNKAAAVWTADLDSLAGFAAEQKTAKGNFPGPLPLIFNGDTTQLEAAASAGASAVVLSSSELAEAEAATKLGMEVVWAVESKEDVGAIVDAGLGDAFLIKEANAQELAAALPKDAVKIAALESMQADNNEIQAGRALSAAGVKSVLMEVACVGDAEDVPYANFCIQGMTSKASSEFKITGMTGHVNGHYGTGTFEKSASTTQWARKGGEGLGPNVSSKAAVVGKSAMRSWAAK
jgi:hypothetical protein